MNLHDAALDYAQRGWPVFPLYTWRGDRCSCGDTQCNSPAKHPHRDLARHGLKNATTNLDTISEWWTRFPTANIGLRTGDIFDVLDVDGTEGEQSILAILEANGEQLPTGPWAHTGGGGQHFLFQRTGITNKAGFLPHVDWRGDGGYIVAAPSHHASGRCYTWDRDAGPDTPLEPTPSWLVAILNPPKPPRQPAPERGNVAYLAVPGQGTRYGIAALEAELHELAQATEGVRNHELNAHAFNLFQLVAGGELDETFVQTQLEHVALGIGLDEREIAQTIGSARRGGMSAPRYAPALPPRLSTGTDGPQAEPEPPPAPTSAPDDPRAVANGEMLAALERSRLDIFDAAEHARRVDTAPPVGWLARGVWPGDAHGVIAAEQKAGKTWAILDLVVAAASGQPWMHLFPIERQGPVVVFLGEGGERKMLRRLRAVCAEHGQRYEDLPIRICFRVPHLTNSLQLAAISEEVAATKPTLVVIDPLYLAARGAKSSLLNEMGEHLENVQHVAQQHGAALVIVHHWNKTGEGKGAKRMTGAGGAEWGRVLVSVSVRSKHTDRDTKATRVVLEWEFEGDEIPDTELRVMRKVWSDNPDDLASPLHYQLTEIEDEGPDVEDDLAHLTPAQKRLLGLLTDDWQTVSELMTATAERGHPLKKRTVQDALKKLREEGLAQPFGESGDSYRWRLTPEGEQ